MTEIQLKELLYEARRIMREDEDSLILFKNRDQKWLDKEIVGVERQSTDNFL